MSGNLRPNSIEELSRRLQASGIDTTSWGIAGAKSVRHLLAEMHVGECSLRQNVDGIGLLRILTRVDIELYLRGHVLVETHTQLGGHTLQRFKLLSVRLREGELWHVGVRRMLHQMLHGLGDAPTAYTLQEGSHTVVSEARLAHSYPGLSTECEVCTSTVPPSTFCASILLLHHAAILTNAPACLVMLAETLRDCCAG